MMSSITYKLPLEKIINTRNFLRRLIFVPKCASCGKRLSPISKRDALNLGVPCLCEKCMEKWQRAKSLMCISCYMTADKCTCIPGKKTLMQPTIPSLFFYRAETKNTEAKLIYTIKHRKNDDAFEFLAKELYPKISELLDELEIAPEECIFTYIPRTKQAIIRDGFDQSEILCKKLCNCIPGTTALPLLIRHGGSEQKRLTHDERKKNVESALKANTSLRGMPKKKGALSELLKGKTVILADDIITTGETVKRAVKLLRSEGAKTVLVCCIGKSEKRQKNKKRT